MMRDVYRCTPAEFDQMDDAVVDMHREFLRIERKQRTIADLREKQRSKRRRE